jgi:hypothetical protein
MATSVTAVVAAAKMTTTTKRTSQSRAACPSAAPTEKTLVTLRCRSTRQTYPVNNNMSFFPFSLFFLLIFLFFF